MIHVHNHTYVLQHVRKTIFHKSNVRVPDLKCLQTKIKKIFKRKKMSLDNTLQPSLLGMLVSNGPPCIPCCTDSEIPGQ